MNLLTSKTSRQLDNKLKLFGFELIDLLLIFLYLAISNLFFSQTTLKIPLVYLGTIILSTILYFAKKEKPKNHLQDKISSYVNPSIFSANLPDENHQSYLKGEYYTNKKNKTTC